MVIELDTEVLDVGRNGSSPAGTAGRRLWAHDLANENFKSRPRNRQKVSLHASLLVSSVGMGETQSVSVIAEPELDGLESGSNGLSPAAQTGRQLWQTILLLKTSNN